VQYGKGEPKLQIQEYYTKDKGETFNPGKALHRMPMEAAYSLVENLSKFLDEQARLEPDDSGSEDKSAGKKSSEAATEV
jgi:hypothetical protein